MFSAIHVVGCARCKRPLVPGFTVDDSKEYYCMNCKQWADGIGSKVVVPMCPDGHGVLYKEDDHWLCHRTGLEYAVRPYALLEQGESKKSTRRVKEKVRV